MVGFMCCQGDFSVHPAISNIVSLLLAARPVNYNWISVAASLGMIARDLECDRNMIVTFLPHSEEAGRFIDETVPKAAWVAPGKMQREEHREYPLDALREAVINAVCHRDYAASGNVQIRFFDNRLQIWNPGKLPDGITVDLLNHRGSPESRACFASTKQNHRETPVPCRVYRTVGFRHAQHDRRVQTRRPLGTAIPGNRQRFHRYLYWLGA